MLKRIYKYTLQMNVFQDLVIPKNGEVLTVQIQKGVPCIWVLFDNVSEVERRRFILMTTGNEMDILHNDRYIGTFQLYDGDFVAHLFERFET